MEQFLNILGFTDKVSIMWNILAYIGMILITIAVISNKWRNQLFVWGPLMLLLYAWFYLHNSILAGLQFIVTTSGVLNFINIKKKAPIIVIVLTIIAYVALLMAGQISGLWSWVGSFGLLGIALGLTQLPQKRGFAIMALGGLLIVIYAFALHIWVFFILNVIFLIANLLELKRNKAIH